MTKWLLILALALPIAACSEAGEQAGTTEEVVVDAAAVEQTIRTAADAYEQAALAGDIEGLSAPYADDATMLAPGMPKQEGIEAIRAAYGQMYSVGAPTTFSLESETIVVAEGGDQAYEAGTFSSSYNGPDGTPMTDTGKYVAIWKPTAEGTWKIALDIWNSDGAPVAATVTTDADATTDAGTGTTY